MQASKMIATIKQRMPVFVGRSVSYEELAHVTGYKNGRSVQAIAEGKPVSPLAEMALKNLLASLPDQDEKLWFPEFTFGENTLTNEETMTIHRNWYPRFLGALIDPDMPVIWGEDYAPIDLEDRLCVKDWIDRPLSDKHKSDVLRSAVSFVVIEKQNIEAGELGV